MAKENILVHTCCATCAGYVIKKLSQDFTPFIYYYNPNIYPSEEYILRRDELKKYAMIKNISFFEDDYDPLEWSKNIKGLENEPEKGLRCNRCFSIRLEKTAAFALQHNFKYFTTTLTISPHKKSNIIIEIGQKIANDHKLLFVAEDFKKMNGFSKTIEIAKTENFYRQKYCGCQYSKKEYTNNFHSHI